VYCPYGFSADCAPGRPSSRSVYFESPRRLGAPGPGSTKRAGDGSYGHLMAASQGTE
jgi:hypothetical protein